MSGSLLAVVPLNALVRAKGRLAGVLDAQQRRHLAADLAAHVLQVCASVADDVLLVAGDAAAAAVGTAAGVEAVVVAEPGLSAALARADAEAIARRAHASLVVAADLPLLQAADLRAVVDALPAVPGVVVAPTDDGGTGALLRWPPTAIATAYGPSSATAHAALARAAGVAVALVYRPGLALDVDTPEQLAAAGDAPTTQAARVASAPTRPTARHGLQSATTDDEERPGCRRAR